MKAILEYNLDDFDDEMAHKRAIKSLDMAFAIWEIVYNAKKRIKIRIELDKMPEMSQYDVVDFVFQHIIEDLKERDIDIDKLIH